MSATFAKSVPPRFNDVRLLHSVRSMSATFAKSEPLRFKFVTDEPFSQIASSDEQPSTSKSVSFGHCAASRWLRDAQPFTFRYFSAGQLKSSTDSSTVLLPVGLPP